MSAPQKTFLITGTSNGYGLELARAAVAAGQKVIASSRNPSKTPELVKEIESAGSVWETLDVAGKDAAERLQEIISKHGPIDVLINNAGYAHAGLLEVLEVDEYRAQFETNVFGVITCIKAVLPSMRERKSGTIVNVSSGVPFAGFPLITAYTASKCAIEGLTQSLAAELSPFNIRVLIANPGEMRTNFIDPARHAAEFPEPYKGTVSEQVFGYFMSRVGNQAGDPVRMAKIVIDEILTPTGTPPIFRLPLGKEAIHLVKTKGKLLIDEAEAVEAIALTGDFPEA